MNVERVRWVDSAWNSGWKGREAAVADARVVYITSVGFVFSEDDRQLVLCMSYDAQLDDAQKYDGFIAIPKVAIEKREVVG